MYTNDKVFRVVNLFVLVSNSEHWHVVRVPDRYGMNAFVIKAQCIIWRTMTMAECLAQADWLTDWLVGFYLLATPFFLSLSLLLGFSKSISFMCAVSLFQFPSLFRMTMSVCSVPDPFWWLCLSLSFHFLSLVPYRFCWWSIHSFSSGLLTLLEPFRFVWWRFSMPFVFSRVQYECSPFVCVCACMRMVALGYFNK